MNSRLENEVSILIDKLLMIGYKFCPKIYMYYILSGSVLIKDCFMKYHITILLKCSHSNFYLYMYIHIHTYKYRHIYIYIFKHAYVD